MSQSRHKKARTMAVELYNAGVKPSEVIDRVVRVFGVRRRHVKRALVGIENYREVFDQARRRIPTRTQPRGRLSIGRGGGVK